MKQQQPKFIQRAEEKNKIKPGDPTFVGIVAEM